MDLVFLEREFSELFIVGAGAPRTGFGASFSIVSRMEEECRCLRPFL